MPHDSPARVGQRLSQHTDPDRRRARTGVALSLAAYVIWGLVPIYFKSVAHVAPLEVVSHRIIWSVPLLLGLIWLRKGMRVAVASLGCRRTVLTLVGTTLLIGANWYLFIWAVAHGRLLQASLGYYINPLVTVLLGFVFLKERLRRPQIVSVGIAALGVAYLTFGHGEFPWLAMVLAVSFGLYGLMRKTARVDAVVGLTVETTLLAPFALGYLAYLIVHGEAALTSGTTPTTLLLLTAGVVTTVPLLCFNAAARRLRLATLGFLQYITPTGHFLLALAYGESMTTGHAITFGCIWTALALYSADAVRAHRRLGRAGRIA
ncbi:MAG: EamA family transporter RarD [bacterium]|nr:EamA family transporter RarD [bacterium]